MKNKFLILFIFLIIFIPKVNAYSNADLLPNLTMPVNFRFYGMSPKVQALPTGYFLSSENVHTDYQKEYYYLNDNWYQDRPGIVASVLLPVDLSDNVLYNGNLVLCSKNDLDFYKYMKLTQIYHGNKWANSYNEANKVKNFSSNLNPIGSFSTEAEDFTNCYNYSFSFTTADTTGPVLGFKFTYNSDDIGPNQNGMAFMGISLDGVGLDLGTELGGIKDSISDVNDNLNNSTEEITGSITDSTNELNGSISNSTTNINNSIDNSTSTITNEVNNMGNQISGTINDNFQTCRPSINLLNVANPFSITLSNSFDFNLNAGTYYLSFSGYSSSTTESSFLIQTQSVGSEIFDHNYFVYFSDKYKEINLPKDIVRIRIFSSSSYNGSVGVTTTFDNFMISKEPGEYEPYGQQICTNKLDDMNNQDISSADKELPDNSTFNDYENVEGQILDQVKKANLDNLKIGLDLNASSFIWDTLTSFIQCHPAVFGLFISLLSIGIIKLALGR